MATALLAILLLLMAPLQAQSMWNSIRSAAAQKEFCAKNPTDRSCRAITAAELLTKCQGDRTERAYCAGTLDAIATSGKAELIEWQCVPDAVIEGHPEQLRIIFVREAHRMPEILHLPARQLLFYAVTKAFPCPSVRSRK